MKEKLYTEEEVKELVTSVCQQLGMYMLDCIENEEDPDTEKEFNRLFDKYKK